jgi:ankyrin repeat protein
MPAPTYAFPTRELQPLPNVPYVSRARPREVVKSLVSPPLPLPPIWQVNARDMENETALHWAALLGHLPSAQLLVARGATSFKNKRGEAPLHVAELAGYLEVAACLRDAERHEAEWGHAPLPVRVHTWAGCMCVPSTLTVSLCELAWVGNFHDFRPRVP